MPPSAAPEWLRVGWSFEITPTSAPASCASIAARMPAQPAPTTRTSCVDSTPMDATETISQEALVRCPVLVRVPSLRVASIPLQLGDRFRILHETHNEISDGVFEAAIYDRGLTRVQRDSWQTTASDLGALGPPL